MNAVAAPTRSTASKCQPTKPASSLTKRELTKSIAAPSKDTFASTAWYRASEAEAVLRTVAEDGTNNTNSDALWGAMTIVGIACNELERFQFHPTTDDCNSVLCYLQQATGVLAFFDDKGDIVLSAGETLLNMAMDILLQGMEGVSNA